MKCLACDFEHEKGTDSDDILLCKAWLYVYSLDKRLPNKEQFEAMQRGGFLPTHGGRDGRTWELPYGHYGWGIDYNWSAIAAKIAEGK
jgi:hypothetical protein